MTHTTTTTDLAALEAEIAALEAAADAQDARVEALLGGWTPSPVVTTQQELAALRGALEGHSAALDVIAAEQAEISAAIDALGL